MSEPSGIAATEILVDDHLLLRLLVDDEPSELRPGGGRVSTTGLWYHRLCRGLADQAVRGAMSRLLGQVDAHVAAAAVRAITELPEEIGLVSLRVLGWPMAQELSEGVRLNLMSLEALAAAQHLDAEICLAGDDHNPPLREAARRRGVALRLVSG